MSVFPPNLPTTAGGPIPSLFSYPVNVTVPGGTGGDMFETGWTMYLPSNNTQFGCFDARETHTWGITEPGVGIAWWNVTLSGKDTMPYLIKPEDCLVDKVDPKGLQVTFSMGDSGQNNFIRAFGQRCVMDTAAKKMGCCWGSGSIYYRAPPRGGEPGRTNVWMPCPRVDDITVPDLEDTDIGPDGGE